MRTLLAHQGKTRADLAQCLDVHVSAITKALNGRRTWSADDVAHMAEFFDVNVAVFFEHPDTLVRSRYFLSNPLVSA